MLESQTNTKTKLARLMLFAPANNTICRKTYSPGKHQLPIRARCFRFQRHRQEEEQSGPAHQLTPDTTRKGILRCVVGRKHSGQVQPATHPPVQHSCQHLAESAPERLGQCCHQADER